MVLSTVHFGPPLLVQQLHQVSDVGLGEDVGANLIDDDLLEFLGIEPGVSQAPLPRLSREWQM